MPDSNFQKYSTISKIVQNNKQNFFFDKSLKGFYFSIAQSIFGAIKKLTNEWKDWITDSSIRQGIPFTKWDSDSGKGQGGGGREEVGEYHVTWIMEG